MGWLHKTAPFKKKREGKFRGLDDSIKNERSAPVLGDQTRILVLKGFHMSQLMQDIADQFYWLQVWLVLENSKLTDMRRKRVCKRFIKSLLLA